MGSATLSFLAPTSSTPSQPEIDAAISFVVKCEMHMSDCLKSAKVAKETFCNEREHDKYMSLFYSWRASKSTTQYHFQGWVDWAY